MNEDELGGAGDDEKSDVFEDELAGGGGDDELFNEAVAEAVDEGVQQAMCQHRSPCMYIFYIYDFLIWIYIYIYIIYIAPLRQLRISQAKANVGVARWDLFMAENALKKLEEESPTHSSQFDLSRSSHGMYINVYFNDILMMIL